MYGMSNDSCAEREEGETPRTLSAAEASGSQGCWQGLSARESAPWLLCEQPSCRCHPTPSRSCAGSCPPARHLNCSKTSPWALFHLHSLGFSPSKNAPKRRDAWSGGRSHMGAARSSHGLTIISEDLGQTTVLNRISKATAIPSACSFWVMIFMEGVT